LAGPDQKHELRRQSARDPSKRPKLGRAQCAFSGEDVTYHHCHASVADLTRRVADFEARLNREPFVIADRLWVKDELDPEEEKLRFSKETWFKPHPAVGRELGHALPCGRSSCPLLNVSPTL